MNLIKRIFVFLFGGKTDVKVRSRGEVRAEMVVTRADGSREYYVADKKGQRRIK